jgi:capsular exopolysaccharide synthesis family protein
VAKECAQAGLEGGDPFVAGSKQPRRGEDEADLGVGGRCRSSRCQRVGSQPWLLLALRHAETDRPEDLLMDASQEVRDVWRNRLWIVAFALLAATTAYVVSSLQTAQYRADAVVRIIPGDDTPAVANAEGLRSLTQTYAELARSDSVFRSAGRREEGGLSAATLKDSARVTTDQPGVLELSSTMAKADQVARGANAHADAFVARVEETEEADRQRTLRRIETRIGVVRRELNRTRKGSGAATALITELQQLSTQSAQIRSRPSDSARIIERASRPQSPVSPRPLRNALFALFLSLLVGVAAAYARLLVSGRYDSGTNASEDLELPLLAELPEAAPQEPGALDAFRGLRTNIEFSLELTQEDRSATLSGSGSEARAQGVPSGRGPLRSFAKTWRRRDSQPPAGEPGSSAPRRHAVILITSPEPGAGKTYVTANLSSAFAADGLRVTAIDGDLRRPTLHEHFDVPLAPGLIDVLDGPDSTDGIPANSSSIPPSAVERGGALEVVAAGHPSHDSAELLATNNMSRLVAHLLRRSNLVVVDSPPTLGIADAAVLSRYSDGVILVIDSKTSSREARRALQTLKSVDAPMLGVIMNRARRERSYYGYGYQPSPTPEAHSLSKAPSR